MATDPRTASLRVRVTREELLKIQKLALAEKRTVSQLAWFAIQEYLQRAAA